MLRETHAFLRRKPWPGYQLCRTDRFILWINQRTHLIECTAGNSHEIVGTDRRVQGVLRFCKAATNGDPDLPLTISKRSLLQPLPIHRH